MTEKLGYYDRQIALWHVRAYPSRKKAFDLLRNSVAAAMPSPSAEKPAPAGSSVSDSTYTKTERLERLYQTHEYKQIKAVEDALETAGTDIRGKAERQKLRRALMLNCTDRKTYPFHRLGIDFVSQRDFFRRRDRFLSEILKRLQYGTAPR